MSRQEYLQLTQLATQYGLTPEEFVKRRALGRRTPRFIGSVLTQIAQVLTRLESQLASIEHLRYSQQVTMHPKLEQNLQQLCGLIKRLNRQFSL